MIDEEKLFKKFKEEAQFGNKYIVYEHELEVGEIEAIESEFKCSLVHYTESKWNTHYIFKFRQKVMKHEKT